MGERGLTAADGDEVVEGDGYFGCAAADVCCEEGDVCGVGEAEEGGAED